MAIRGYKNKVSVLNGCWNERDRKNYWHSVVFFELELAKHFKFLKLNFNHILPIAVLKSSVTAAKRKLENSREKIYMWQESREEIPGQFNRKIVVLRSGENFGGNETSPSKITRTFRRAETFSEFGEFSKKNV